MKKTSRLLQLLSILLLYCFAVGFQSAQAFASREVSAKKYSDQRGSFFSLSTVTIVSYVSKANSLSAYLFNYYSSGYDVAGASTSYRFARLLLENKLSNYVSFCRQIVINLERFHIIFPFHHFL